MPPAQFDKRYSHSVEVPANADAVFRFLDDPIAVSGHMANRRGMMAGTAMRLQPRSGTGSRGRGDDGAAGHVLGRRLEVTQRVCLREPPRHKTRETVGAPMLLVIGAYRLASESTATQPGCRVRIVIDYNLPQWRPSRLHGRHIGGLMPVGAWSKYCRIRAATSWMNRNRLHEHSIPRLSGSGCLLGTGFRFK